MGRKKKGACSREALLKDVVKDSNNITNDGKENMRKGACSREAIVKDPQVNPVKDSLKDVDANDDTKNIENREVFELSRLMSTCEIDAHRETNDFERLTNNQQFEEQLNLAGISKLKCLTNYYPYL